METNVSLLDHGFVFLMAVVYPVAGLVSFRRLLRRVAAGETVNRSQLYRNTFIGHWLVFVAGMAIWAGAARPWADLGLGLTIDLWFGVAALLTVLGIAALVLQLRHVSTASQEQIESLKKRFGAITVLIPQNGNELVRWYGLSTTAGIVEEILWRGYLIWYLDQFMPLWAAVLVSTVAFGLAHAYQGAAHIPQVILLAAAFAGLYLLSGSVWLPIILHAAVDILQGRLGHDVAARSTIGNDSNGTPGEAATSASSHR